MRSSFAFVWWVCDVSIWHGAEGLGGATIATAIQGYNRRAERVPGMPALDPHVWTGGALQEKSVRME